MTLDKCEHDLVREVIKEAYRYSLNRDRCLIEVLHNLQADETGIMYPNTTLLCRRELTKYRSR